MRVRALPSTGRRGEPDAARRCGRPAAIVGQRRRRRVPAARKPPAPTGKPPGRRCCSVCLSGNLVAKFGIVILFFGVAFFIKFALENAIVPVEVWFALAALGGAILLASAGGCASE
jgi:uncharacterized membrane protein